jgi:hypothetical protein
VTRERPPAETRAGHSSSARSMRGINSPNIRALVAFRHCTHASNCVARAAHRKGNSGDLNRWQSSERHRGLGTSARPKAFGRKSLRVGTLAMRLVTRAANRCTHLGDVFGRVPVALCERSARVASRRARYFVRCEPERLAGASAPPARQASIRRSLPPGRPWTVT